MILGASRDASHGRVPELLRLLHLRALAIVTVVCGGCRSPARGTASLAASVAVAAHDGASAVRWAAAPQASRQWHQRRDEDLRPDADLGAVEADLDEDDRETLTGVADEPASPVSSVWPPRKPRRGLRVEPQNDTSRFAAGTGLPRGPPT
jgi:hypothetical protein